MFPAGQDISLSAAARAHRICAEHNAMHPSMANVPIQSVYEWLVLAQLEMVQEMIAHFTKAIDAEIERRGTAR